MSLVNRAIWQIESKLHTPLALASLAELCAVSPYHLARTFRAATGLTPVAYLRSRRLAIAAEALAGTNAGLLTIALDAQYGSHEAFSRAFSAAFGVPPRQVRARRSTRNLTLMEPLSMADTDLVPVDAPRLQTRVAFRVTGLVTRCDNHDPSSIPPLWQRLNTWEGEIPGAVAGTAYGVCFDGGEAGFSYIAGYESTAHGAPDGMESLDLPAGRYAVFTHHGDIAEFPRFVHSIWNGGLSANGLTAAAAPDFEVYDSRFDAQSGRGQVEVWIPVAG